MTFRLWRCLCLTAPLYTYLLNTKNTNSSTKHCNICEWCPMSLFFEGLQWMLRLLFLSVRNIMKVSMFKGLLNCSLSVFYFWLWLFFGWVISPVGYLPGSLSLWLSFCWSSHASTYSSQSVSQWQGRLQSCHTNIKNTFILHSFCVQTEVNLIQVLGERRKLKTPSCSSAPQTENRCERKNVKVLLFDPAKSCVFPKTI